MAKPARMPVPSEVEPDIDTLDDEAPGSWVHRWVSLPDGSRELQELPLTPEYFLDPRFGDQMVQGPVHSDVTQTLSDFLKRRYLGREDILVFSDVKLLWGHREWRRPAPDVTLVEGVRNPKRKRRSFNVVREGVRPTLVIEVVSEDDAELRYVDQVEKVSLYARERIPEYLLLDPPQKATGYRYQWTGYRLDANRQYQKIEPDAEGRIFSETTGLWFGVSPDGQQVCLFDAVTGKRLLTSEEEQRAREAAEARVVQEVEARKVAEVRAADEAEARKVAEARADSEAEARKTLEAELVRLREENARLKGGIRR
jgi:Uma2 family endonuclease